MLACVPEARAILAKCYHKLALHATERNNKTDFNAPITPAAFTAPSCLDNETGGEGSHQSLKLHILFLF